MARSVIPRLPKAERGIQRGAQRRNARLHRSARGSWFPGPRWARPEMTGFGWFQREAL